MSTEIGTHCIAGDGRCLAGPTCRTCIRDGERKDEAKRARARELAAAKVEEAVRRHGDASPEAVRAHQEYVEVAMGRTIR